MVVLDDRDCLFQIGGCRFQSHRLPLRLQAQFADPPLGLRRVMTSAQIEGKGPRQVRGPA